MSEVFFLVLFMWKTGTVVIPYEYPSLLACERAWIAMKKENNITTPQHFCVRGGP